MLKVSVVIPALNQEIEIGRTIQQFWAPEHNLDIEVIVADAGSMDGTQAVSRLLADQLLVVPCIDEHWKSDAKNAGAAAASGDILLFLEPQSRLLSSLQSLIGEIQTSFGNGAKLAGAHISNEVLLVRKTAFEQSGGFAAAHSKNENEQLLERLAIKAPVADMHSIHFDFVEFEHPELEEILA